MTVLTLPDVYPITKTVIDKSNNTSLSSTTTTIGVALVIHHIAAAVAECAVALRTASVKQASVTNSSGDDVLSVDLLCDRIIQKHICQCSSVGAFSSEETPELVTLAKLPSDATTAGGELHTVAFDPLDGSSVIDSNFSVGSIFGIWPGIGIVGKKVGDQVASMVAVYGPRTTLFVATRSRGVIQFVLHDDTWQIAASPTTTPTNPIASIKIAPVAKMFSPGNLRAVNTVKWYRRFIFTELVQNNATLRYTGGMVPDVMHILVKGNGVFMTPRSHGHKVKLRIAYECGPLAFMVSCAGGYATSAGSPVDSADLNTSIICDPDTGVCVRRRGAASPVSFNMLEKVILANDERGVVSMGSSETVLLYEAYALGKARRRAQQKLQIRGKIANTLSSSLSKL